MAHVSARPHWLTDPMLAEMRRLRGSSKDYAAFYMAVTGSIMIRDTHDNADSKEYWVAVSDGYQGCWLTEAGHKALAAIEAEEPPVCTVTVTKTDAPPEPKNLWDRFNNEAQRRATETAMRLAGYTDMPDSNKLVCMQALAQAEARAVARELDIDPDEISVTVTTNGMGFYDVKIEIDPLLGLAMKETP